MTNICLESGGLFSLWKLKCNSTARLIIKWSNFRWIQFCCLVATDGWTGSWNYEGVAYGFSNLLLKPNFLELFDSNYLHSPQYASNAFPRPLSFPTVCLERPLWKDPSHEDSTTWKPIAHLTPHKGESVGRKRGEYASSCQSGRQGQTQACQSLFGTPLDWPLFWASCPGCGRRHKATPTQGHLIITLFWHLNIFLPSDNK